MNSSGLEKKIIENLFAKFTKKSDKWLEFIEISFLPDEMKKQYKQTVQNKSEVLRK